MSSLEVLVLLHTYNNTDSDKLTSMHQVYVNQSMACTGSARLDTSICSDSSQVISLLQLMTACTK